MREETQIKDELAKKTKSAANIEAEIAKKEAKRDAAKAEAQRLVYQNALDIDYVNRIGPQRIGELQAKGYNKYKPGPELLAVNKAIDEAKARIKVNSEFLDPQVANAQEATAQINDLNTQLDAARAAVESYQKDVVSVNKRRISETEAAELESSRRISEARGKQIDANDAFEKKKAEEKAKEREDQNEKYFKSLIRQTDDLIDKQEELEDAAREAAEGRKGGALGASSAIASLKGIPEAAAISAGSLNEKLKDNIDTEQEIAAVRLLAEQTLAAWGRAQIEANVANRRLIEKLQVNLGQITGQVKTTR